MFSFQQINETSKRLQIYNVRCSREIKDMGKGFIYVIMQVSDNKFVRTCSCQSIFL